MTSRKCTNCGRTFAADQATKFHCCGQPVRVPAGPRQPGNRQVSSLVVHAQNALHTCRSCEHFATEDGKSGCGLFVERGMGSLCQSVSAIVRGGGCFEDPPRFLPCGAEQWALHQQPSLDDHCVAVTSLSCLPHHLTRQAECLSSWRRAGLTITAVNRPSEIDDLERLYPQVSQWIPEESPLTDYDRYTPRINDLADIAIQLDRTILLINSDIEIYGDQRLIIEPIANGEQLVGVRWNYTKGNLAKASREQWGLDAFSFTPKQAKGLPRLRLRIGRPMWDYWIPLHSRTAGQPMHFIGDPLFYHESHEVYWSKEDWDRAAKWVGDHYSYDFGAWAQPFRRSFPYPPK